MNMVHKEERREGYVEMPQEFVAKLTKHVSEEDGFFKAFKIFAWVFSILIAVLVWIFLEKNQDIKAMNVVLMDHSAKLERTLVVIEGLVRADQNMQNQIDRNTQKIWK